MKPEFRPGRNIAMKVPAQEYKATVAFYADVLGLKKIAESASSATESTRFEFGDKILWIDRVETASQAEIWLEIATGDVEAAAAYLAEKDLARRDEIEPLPEGMPGFWISSPCNIIHLVTAPDEP